MVNFKATRKNFSLWTAKKYSAITNRNFFKSFSPQITKTTICILLPVLFRYSVSVHTVIHIAVILLTLILQYFSTEVNR